MSFLITSTTVNFSEPRQDIRLEEDKERIVEPKVFSGQGGWSIATTKRFVRMYHKPSLSPVVTAITGSVNQEGMSTAKDVTELVATTPDNPFANVPGWATNVRVKPVGKAISADGKTVPVTWYFNAVKMAVVPSQAVYGVCQITYDAPYRLYLYEFSGACPIKPPTNYDSSGNRIPVSTESFFTNGLLYAVDYGEAVSSYLSMTPPSCEWPSVRMGEGPRADSAKQIPSMKLEMDPEFPPAFTRTGNRLTCQAVIRAYPAGAARNVYVTEGTIYPYEKKGTLRVDEVLLFQLESAKTLAYPPDGAVNLQVLKVFEAPFGYGSVYDKSRGVRGPGSTVFDVEDGENPLFASNRTPRVLGPMEVAAVGGWDEAVRVIATVRATYVSRYDSYVYRFSFDETAKEFRDAGLVAVDNQDRTASMRLSPPSMKSRSRKFFS
jgi:hypothetical protein